MEPKNHLIENENNLRNLLLWVQNVDFPGCNVDFHDASFLQVVG